jgi:hypothetical protein
MLKTKPRLQSALDPDKGWVRLLSSRRNLLTALTLAILAVLVLGALGTWRISRSLQIEGYAGHLGEWELTATLSKDGIRELSGPLIMKHIGLCSQDGPEEKTGQMRLRPSLVSSWIEASLSIDGIECTYSAAMSDAYIGQMICPDRPAVPLTLWAR